MDNIKEQITQVLDKRGILSRLKAELRANVFLAIIDQDIKQGGVGLSGKTDTLLQQQVLADPAGVLLLELVRDFLQCCNMQFTLQVFEPELQLAAGGRSRNSLLQELGLDGTDSSKPLLLELLHTYLQTRLCSTTDAPELHFAPPIQLDTISQGSGMPPSTCMAAAPQVPTAASVPQAESAAAIPAQAKAAAASGASKQQQTSKSGSFVDDVAIDEGLIDTTVDDAEQQYGNVFLAAWPYQQSVDDAGASSSGNSAEPSPRPPSRSVRDLHSMATTQQVASAVVPLHSDSQDSSSPGLSAASNAGAAAADSPVAVVPAATLGEPAAAGIGSLEQLAGPPQHHAAGKTAVVPAPAPLLGRLAPLQPLASLRANKLPPLPLPSLKGPGAGSGNAWQPTANGMGDEPLRTWHKPNADQPGNGSSGTAAAVAASAASADSDGEAHETENSLLDHSPAPLQQGPTGLMSPQPASTGSTELAGGFIGGQVVDPTRLFGAAAAGGSSSDENSDDFGVAEQRQLYEAARIQLSNGSQTTQQQQQVNPATLSAPCQPQEAIGQLQQVVADISGTETDILEDISLPLEGFDDEQSAEYGGAAQSSGYNDADVVTSNATGGGRHDLDVTGLSLDRSIDIDHLMSVADFQINDDDF